MRRASRLRIPLQEATARVRQVVIRALISGRLRTGDRVAGPLFDVEVIEADDLGVRKLLFTFAKPLASQSYRFYLTSKDSPAAPIRFLPPADRPAMVAGAPGLLPGGSTPAFSNTSADDAAAAGGRLFAGDPKAAEVLFAAVQSEDQAVRRRAWTAFQQVALPLARTLGSPVVDLLSGEVPSPADLSTIAAWWAGHIDGDVMDELWLHRHDFENLRAERDAVFNVRSIAAKIIRTDLYLTGPPFPGPR